ncbi:MAG: hypothetical protein ACYC7E_23305 [Armatimonadota bacterium]
MPNVWEWIAILFDGAKAILEKLQATKVEWKADLDGEPVTLLGLAVKLGKPQSAYRVRYAAAEKIEHVIRALHDFDGKPADVLTMDGQPLTGGDMDIMIQVFKSQLVLQWEWTDGTGFHRLRLVTDLRESPVGQVIEDLVE